MPLLVSKLKSVTVGEDDVITSFASNLCQRCPFVVAKKVVPYASWRTLALYKSCTIETTICIMPFTRAVQELCENRQPIVEQKTFQELCKNQPIPEVALLIELLEE